MSITYQSAGGVGRETQDDPGSIQDGPCRVADRGPNWLFIRVQSEGMESLPTLSQRLWAIARRHFVYRLVLELDELGKLDPHLIDELLKAKKLMTQQGGALRLCGMRPSCSRALLAAERASSLANHSDRHAAVGDSWCGATSEDPRRDQPEEPQHQTDTPANPLPAKPR